MKGHHFDCETYDFGTGPEGKRTEMNGGNASGNLAFGIFFERNLHGCVRIKFLSDLFLPDRFSRPKI